MNATKALKMSQEILSDSKTRKQIEIIENAIQDEINAGLDFLFPTKIKCDEDLSLLTNETKNHFKSLGYHISNPEYHTGCVISWKKHSNIISAIRNWWSK